MSYSHWVPIGYTRAAGGEGQIITAWHDDYDYLRILIRISGSALAVQPEVRFNFDASPVNYSSASSVNFAAPTNRIAGVATGIRLFEGGTTGASGLIVMDVINFLNRGHGITWQGSILSEAAATAPSIVCGAGVWQSVGKIALVVLATDTSTFLANTDMAVFGSDIGFD